VSKVLVTDMSETGKSSVLDHLAARGHEVVDTDDDAWCRWVIDEDGAPDWIWREDAVAALLDAPRTCSSRAARRTKVRSTHGSTASCC
jgi:hypothetical protein